MEKCIYTRKEPPDSTFRSGEHIFPASIGGVQKLDKEWVSQEFNNMISVAERDFARAYPLVILPRMMEGPEGRKNHRGRFGIGFMKSIETNTLQLGYIQEGKPKTIPQIIVDMSLLDGDKKGNLRGIVSKAGEEKELLKGIKRKCYPQIIDTEDYMAHGKLIVGVFNKQLYLGKSTELSREIAVDYLNKLVDKVNKGVIKENDDSGKELVREHITYISSIKFSVKNIQRIYGKIAFNVLAKLKGQKFVLNSMFDNFVDAVTTGKDIEKYVSMPEVEVSKEFNELLQFNNDEHFVFIKRDGKELQGVVNLYGNKGSVMVKFCDDFSGYFECCGYVCDWVNKREYTLEEYLEDAMQRGEFF